PGAGVPAPERDGAGYRAALRPGEEAHRGDLPRGPTAGRGGGAPGAILLGLPRGRARGARRRRPPGRPPPRPGPPRRPPGPRTPWPAHPQWLARSLAVLGTRAEP